ncbi:MAG TPA: MFS transporter [Nocardioides sp.]|uniref:MFS transporter n=1 Tax=uncultured Nocardioides sp. TaxID=198441 RepID=UPI002636277D|nr:MFS transporter [uncultured Nocardioides sp.]HRD60545.1 MFS transporter [Nocardioides sp.]HRK44634.1 MFS transporter [Nocardioides sp.]
MTGRDPKWWTLVAVCLGVFILLLDITIVNVALVDIQDDLDATLADLQWVIDAYALSLAALLLTAGSLADLYGRRLLFVIGTVLFMVGSIACGAAQDIFFLQLARAFQGIGGAAMFATALALIASAFSGRDRGVAFGAFGATTGVAVAIGPVLGGVLTSGLSWRWIFFVNIPICLLALAIAVGRVRESHDPRAGRPDWFGFVTFSLALGSLVYGLIRAGQTSWDDSRVVFCLVAAAVLLVAFVIIQLRGTHPMFDLTLLRKPTFTGGLVAAFGVSASVFSLLTYLVIYVQNVLGYSAVEAGVRFLFLSAAAFVSAAVAGRLTVVVPAKWLIAPGFAVLGVGLLLIHGIDVDSTWTHLIPGLIVSGLGIGLINTPLASTAVGVVSVERSGMASGINSTFRQVGVATGIAVLGTIFSHQIADGIRSGLADTPAAGQSDQVATAVTGGQVGAVIQASPPGVRDQIAAVATSSFVDALNHITLIATVLAFVCAVVCFVTIRQQDFVQGGPGAPGGH